MNKSRNTLITSVVVLLLSGCELFGSENGYECLPPPCGPNELCINSCGDIFTVAAPPTSSVSRVRTPAVRNLTKNPGWESNPVWSPDGVHIAFVKDQASVYIMRSDGSERRRLTDASMTARSPAWSPDGTQIAFIAKEEQDYLYVVQAAGEGYIRLTEAQEFSGVRWSPDGQTLLFISRLDGQSDVSIINADGTQQRRLTNTPEGEVFATWSPDGTQVAFIAYGAETVSLYVINADGTELRQLSSPGDNDTYPTWSPDGQWIAFQSETESGSGIHLIRADGSDRRVLTSPNDGGFEPAWSPDARWIVYVSYSGDLYLIAPEGGVPFRLTMGATTAFGARWSLDGNYIVFRG